MAETYWVPYLKVIRQERTSNGYYIVLSNGTTLTFFTDGYTNSNNIYTPRGLYIVASFNNNTEHYASTTRDYSKKDVIMVVNIDEENARVKFFNWGGETRDGIKNTSKYACNKNIAKDKRYNCGALLQVDGWEVRDDYPW